LLGGFADGGAVAELGGDQEGEDEEGKDGERVEDRRAYGDVFVSVVATAGSGEVAAEDEGPAGDGLVGLVDGIAAEDYGIATDSSLRVDDGVAADDSGIVVDPSADVEAAEEHEDAAGDVPFYLDRAEEADGVVHLLACGDEDVLPDVGTVARRLAQRCGGKQEGEAEKSEQAGEQYSPRCVCASEPVAQVSLCLYAREEGRVPWLRR